MEKSPSLNEILAVTLKNLRLQNKLSQEELAGLAKVDRTYISGIERGRRNITISTLERLIPHLSKDPISFFRSLCEQIRSGKLDHATTEEIPAPQKLKIVE